MSRRANHLRGETSPYLIQHLYNPVDWHPWGSEALERARCEHKPIFLSIGYAACHWCHVMERESFEDEAVATFLNDHFVSIKVDREERPDVDDIYMNAVQLMTGAGGWPLNVFLTPDLRPFFGGTYFPPDNRHGRPGFPQVLRELQRAWAERPDEIELSAERMTEHLRRIAAAEADGDGDGSRVGRAEAAAAAAELTRRFDATWGGFGAAPKFPPDGALALLLREHARTREPAPLAMAERTLDAMALGGLYDQIGGGFARYSVDERWLVPHFEKMLYNQALLVPVYLDAWLVTRKPLYRRVAEETLDFVRRELTHPDGGLWSSLDADSEGEEGRFYVWTPAEIADALDAEGAAELCRLYDVGEPGNFEGKSIPNLIAHPGSDAVVERLRRERTALLEAREQRVRPGTDDKVLTAWNGLMISAFARGYQTLGREADLQSARRAADFVIARLSRGDRLLVSWREGRAQLNGYLDDYAFFARGLLDLYESTFDRRDLDRAASFARAMVRHFGDPERGGFWFTSDDHETLLTRNRSLHDGALPSGAGVAAELLLRLALHLDDEALRTAGLRALEFAKPLVGRMPSAWVSTLAAADIADGPTHEIAIVGAPEEAATAALLGEVRNRYLPRRAVGLAAPGAGVEPTALLASKTASGAATAWVCRNYTCREPTSDPLELARQLGEF